MEGQESRVSGMEKEIAVEAKEEPPMETKSVDRNSIFKERRLEHPTSDLDTLVHLVKGCLGSGILAMPLAFKNAGLHFGLAATFVIGLISTHCVHMLVETAHGLCRKLRIPSLTYGDVAEKTFENGPTSIRGFGFIASRVVNSFIVTVTLGVCGVYLVFVASNIGQVIDIFTGGTFPLRAYISCFVPVMLVLCTVRNLRLLSPFSFLSNLLVLASLGIVFSYVFTGLPPTSSRPDFTSIEQLPAFFSTAVFALEGIGVMMPIENNMKTPQNFTGCFRVLNTGMVIITSLFAAVGYFGYLRYGDKTLGSISLNVPDTEPLGQASKLMLGLAMTFTYPLQMYVAVQMTWPELARKRGWTDLRWRGFFQPEHVYRYVLVIFTAILALAIPKLDALMNLIGAVCLSTAGLIFPAVLETLFRYDNLGKFYWILAKNMLIILFGLLGFATGMVTSIQGVIKSFSGEE
ncbi:hypothetical protein J437_LFUL010805 [Ladona fulva]|uniref:Amino acid transporter transmembrane domain-containing protein n=1 Tax=Ladona fulva TaxID=123851 RepID=A0A8K0KSL6_LADFU|nr:hypothetical protein J437_LFUL010805 [Ladona fulva]